MKKSAGILLFRRGLQGIEFFLVHPGGPFWKNKDLGAWSIPKGEFTEGEEPLKAAIREFREETGHHLEGSFKALTPVRQKGGKWIHAFCLEKDIPSHNIQSNSFQMEWPPRSGKMQTFPEVDRASWFASEEAMQRILPSQIPVLQQVLGDPAFSS